MIIKCAQKAQKIHTEGLATFRAGKVPLFVGFPPELNRRFITAIRFKEATSWPLMTRIMLRLITLEHALDLQFFLAMRDFPLHSTLMEGVVDGDSSCCEVFQTLLQDPVLTRLRSSLDGETINFPYLALDKAGNVLLVAEEIPDAVAGFRENIASVYQRYGLKPRIIEGLLHITIARVVEFPSSNPSQIEDFLDGFDAIKNGVRTGLQLIASSETAAGASIAFLT